MSVEEIKVLVHRFFESVNKGKTAFMAAIEELYATDYVEHGGMGEYTRGIQDYKQSLGEFYRAFPDVHATLDDIIVEGDKAAVRYTLTGTHKGEFMGALATNKKVTIEEIIIIRIVGRKFVESWARYDTFCFMQQLGLIPTPKKESKRRAH